MAKSILHVFSSLRLTVALLCAAMVLVLLGTLAQVRLGLWETQRSYFQSYFIWWRPGHEFALPVWPGGYLVGWLLLVNVICAYSGRMRKLIEARNAGLLLIHSGLLLMLFGQFLTDRLQVESAMRLAVGETRSYSESAAKTELAIIESSGPDEIVTVIPEEQLKRQGEVESSRLPFTIELDEWQANSEPSVASATRSLVFSPQPVTRKMDEVNMPSARITTTDKQGEERTFFVSTFLSDPLTAGRLAEWAGENGARPLVPPAIQAGGRQFKLALRFVRHYKFFGGLKPSKITLLEFRHDRYPGTAIDKAFSSRVRIWNPNTGEERETVISMNEPLRYRGETFYQGGFDPRYENVSILQVVRNPVWLSPYISCAMVGLGLLVHFLVRLASTTRQAIDPPAIPEQAFNQA